MPISVLVTWATRYGSTREVAEAVAEVLRENGLAVEARPLQNVDRLDDFDAIVLGCAIYVSRIHRDARRFLSANRDTLSRKPVALFVLGPVHNDEKQWSSARGQVSKELGRFPWFHPVAQAIFGGRWDPATVGFPFRFLPALKSMPVSDARDWDGIRAWAGTLVEAFKPAHPML